MNESTRKCGASENPHNWRKLFLYNIWEKNLYSFTSRLELSSQGPCYCWVRTKQTKLTCSLRAREIYRWNTWKDAIRMRLSTMAMLYYNLYPPRGVGKQADCFFWALSVPGTLPPNSRHLSSYISNLKINENATLWTLCRNLTRNNLKLKLKSLTIAWRTADQEIMQISTITLKNCG